VDRRLTSESARGVTERDEETEEVPSGLLEGGAGGGLEFRKVSHLSEAYVRRVRLTVSFQEGEVMVSSFATPPHH
jgi:hypothetical protein